MSDGRKDLTRIEDLGEFLHDLDGPEDFLPPDLPPELNAGATSLTDSTENSLSSFDGAEGFAAAPETEPSDGFSAEAFSSAHYEHLPEAADSVEEFASFAAESDTPFTLSDASPEAAPDEELHLATEELSAGLEESFVEANEHFSDAASLTRTDPLPPTEFTVPAAETTAEAVSQDPTSEEEPSPGSTYSVPEDFADTRRYGEALRIDEGNSDCNPAFSVVARNIRFLEDSQDILALLKEAGFPEDMMEQFRRQIDRGTLLIPRVSEFAAIYLCHQLRRFRLELSMGPSDLVHTPRKGQEGDRGLVSRKTLGQNYQHQFQFKGDHDSARAILLSTLSQLDGHTVERYLGVASEHTFLSADMVESEATEFIHQSYDELALKLKGHALQSQANAVIGINYQLTPLPDSAGLGHYRYKLSCTGNLVWLHKLID